MRKIRKVWLCSLLVLFAACVSGGKRELLQQSHTNSAERLMRDSIYMRDSIFVAHRADTVFYEKLRTVYRDRLRVDTFIMCDTVCKEKVVTVEKIVKKYPSPWLLLLAIALYAAWRKGILQLLWRFLCGLLKYFIG
ncbi:MAG: hypothetical protein IJZ22_07760 [Bacteroidaceae bacterium]|nr:hypothetical protein [Bacteroidaceae bacterium]